MRPRSMVPVAAASALLGCLAAVAVVVGLDLGGGPTTTIFESAPLARSTDVRQDGGLTAHEIYRRDAPGVVFVRADVVRTSDSPFDFGLPQDERGTSTGSGFVIDDKEGTILTNAHVIEGALPGKITVAVGEKRVTAKVVGKDESTDLAVLEVDPSGLNLVELPLGTSKLVQVGDPTIAIGNPLGLERTLTTGVISAKKRTIRAPNDFRIENVLQTDAALNPGNSGGPLINAAGQVIGINSQIAASSSGGSVGIGFAVPIDTAKQILPELIKTGRVNRAFLGLTTVAIDKRLEGLNLPVTTGALVQTVTDGGPAALAGIRGGDLSAELDGEQILLGGDILVAIDGKPLTSEDGVTSAIAGKRKGEKVEVQLLRDNKSSTVEVTLGERPNGSSATP